MSGIEEIEVVSALMSAISISFLSGLCVGYNHKKDGLKNAGRLRTVSAHATRAVFTNRALANPMAVRTHRCVARGHYTDHQRTDLREPRCRPCVCKWFRPRVDPAVESTYFERDLGGIPVARDLIRRWNDLRLMNDVEIVVQEVCSLSKDSSVVLIEPFIEGCQKFNSNTGWAWDGGDTATAVSQQMQALSHFSYHASDGQMLLCDLQGWYERGDRNGTLLLSGPVLHSWKGELGAADLGVLGIYNFFHHHRCNEFCDKEWRKPDGSLPHLLPEVGTKLSI